MFGSEINWPYLCVIDRQGRGLALAAAVGGSAGHGGKHAAHYFFGVAQRWHSGCDFGEPMVWLKLPRPAEFNIGHLLGGTAD